MPDMYLINPFPTQLKLPTDVPFLFVSEIFYGTIQGENNVGFPAVFMRLQGCTLGCSYCDTKEVWKYGNPYGIKELIEIFTPDILPRLKSGHHLVITGGSPLKQQKELTLFLEGLQRALGFLPYIEIENECVINPTARLASMVSCWNNSPKLNNSGNLVNVRYNPFVIAETAKLNNSWFKFVVTGEEDWQEIQTDFLDTGLISKDQIVLMPEGQTREEVMENSKFIVMMAITHSVRYTTREHIILWDKKLGV